ncbi:MAG: hypothetical protein AAGJ52_09650 [Pseudomonadota bacterium]
MIWLYFAALLAAGIGAAHSLLGERFVLQRIERLENLPRLILRKRELMAEVLQFAWHITTVAWVGFAALLVLMAHGRLSNASAGLVISATFLLSSLIALVASRGKHYAWIVFLLIGLCSLHPAMG